MHSSQIAVTCKAPLTLASVPGAFFTRPRPLRCQSPRLITPTFQCKCRCHPCDPGLRSPLHAPTPHSILHFSGNFYFLAAGWPAERRRRAIDRPTTLCSVATCVGTRMKRRAEMISVPCGLRGGLAGSRTKPAPPQARLSSLQVLPSPPGIQKL